MRISDRFKHFLFEDNRFADIAYNIIKVFISIVILGAILLPLYMIISELIRIEIDVRKCVENGRDEIKKANELDITAAHENNMAASMVDRLTLTDARIDGMAEGVRQVAALPDNLQQLFGLCGLRYLFRLHYPHYHIPSDNRHQQSGKYFR